MPKITVGIRVKPEEVALSSKNLIQRDESRAIDIVVAGTKHEFQFDKIFNSNCDQEAIFRRCSPAIIDDVLEGFNGCILTYGQTGILMFRLFYFMTSND